MLCISKLVQVLEMWLKWKSVLHVRSNNDLEENGRGVFEVIYRHLHVSTEENRNNLRQDSRCPAGHLASTSEQRYRLRPAWSAVLYRVVNSIADTPIINQCYHNLSV